MPPAQAPSKKPQSVRRGLVIWRWVFLCALTSLATLLFMWQQYGPFLSFAFYPYRAEFVGVVYAATTVFLLFVSPFFFRRLRGLAILAWLVAIWAAVWCALPVFRRALHVQRLTATVIFKQ